jgi:hypothetical protein
VPIASVTDASRTQGTIRTRNGARAAGDRLAEHWGVRDEPSVLFQLGVLEPPDASLVAI